MTLPEVLLWQALRERAAEGVKFRRQHPIGPYVLDFYSSEHRLAVEVDGWGHNMGPAGRDERRDAHLLREGIRTLRIPAVEVLQNLDAVVDAIIGECRRSSD